MIRPRAMTLAAMLAVVIASEASAQFFSTRPQQQQAPSVCEGFIPIRQEAEKGMEALKTANERKAPREEFCQIFSKLAVTNSKMIKFLEQHQSVCNIPPEAVQRSKADYGKLITFRKQACSAPPAAASGPKLSDVLGAPVLQDSTANKPNDSIFNTLTGNPLSTPR